MLLGNSGLMSAGFFLLIPLLSVHLTRDLGYSGALAGAVLAVRQVTQQGLMVFGGVLADRIGYRRAISAGLLVRALGFFGFALGDGLPLILLSAVVAALGGALFEATGKAALASLVPPDERPRLFSLSAIVGSIGSAERMEFTGIGTTVNVASRIESLNKTLGTTLLLSKATRDALRSAAELKALPAQMVKGVAQPVEVFTLAELAPA